MSRADLDAQRALFESWFWAKYAASPALNNLAWGAWQAALASQAPALQPIGFVVGHANAPGQRFWRYSRFMERKSDAEGCQRQWNSWGAYAELIPVYREPPDLQVHKEPDINVDGYPMPVTIETLQAEVRKLRIAYAEAIADKEDAVTAPQYKLPELPQQMMLSYERPHGLQTMYYFTAAQMDDYGKACYAFGRGTAVRDYINTGAAPSPQGDAGDTARIDWLQQNATIDSGQWVGSDLRAAIDAARKAKR